MVEELLELMVGDECSDSGGGFRFGIAPNDRWTSEVGKFVEDSFEQEDIFDWDLSSSLW